MVSSAYSQLVDAIALTTIEPLCKGSQELFKEMEIRESDHIRISFHETEGENGPELDPFRFKIRLFSIVEHWQTGERVQSQASYYARRWLDRLPEHKQSGRDYLIPVSDIACLMINYHWQTDQIHFDTPEVENAYKFELLKFLDSTARVKARYDVDGYEYLDHPDFPLATYQVRPLKGSLGQPGFALFMEQGTGKTPVCIARICNEALAKAQNLKEEEEGNYYRALVICPKNVRTNWVHELRKFATVAGRVTVIDGGEIERMKCLVEAMQPLRPGEEWSVVVCSYDSVANTPALQAVPWDLAIADESHYIKNPSTNRFKAMLELRDVCRQRMALTGTPVTNSLYDLWAQFEWLGPNLSGFSSFKSFRDFHSEYAKAGYGQQTRQKVADFTNVPMLQERLARYAYLIKKEEALPNLPDKVHDIVEVEMVGKQLEFYRKVCSDLLVEIESDLNSSENVELTITSTLTKLLRLGQITSGFVGFPTTYDLEDGATVAQGSGIYRFDPNPKVEALMELLKAKDPEQKTIVWSCHVQDIKTIAARCRVEGIDCVTYYGSTGDHERDLAVYRFNCDPLCKVFIGNPAAGGTGLNLLGYDTKLFTPAPTLEGVKVLARVVKDNDWMRYSPMDCCWVEDPDGINAYDAVEKVYAKDPLPETYCDHVIYYAQNWSYPHRAQSEDRAHRRGTAIHVRYTDLVVPQSIDEEIRVRVVEKKINATKIQDVRSVLNRIRLM